MVSSPPERDLRTRPNELRARLARHGVRVSVDTDGTLAVLRPTARDTIPTLDAALRAAIVTLARECGFTHVALELPDASAGEHDGAGDADVHRAEPLA